MYLASQMPVSKFS